MKKVLMVSVLLGSFPLMAEEVDYKHCAGTLGELFELTNKFAVMDSKGEIKVNNSASSMEIHGNKIVYTSSTTQKNSKKITTSDKETFEIEYESIVEGKPSGKIKNVSYNIKDLKDLDNKKPGALDIAFDYKNGHCVPLVTKIDNTAGLSGGLKLLYKGMMKMTEFPQGERDLYKCKALDDYMKEERNALEACMNSQKKLEKLEQLVNDVEAKSGKSVAEVDSSKIRKSLNSSFETVVKAYQASSACYFSGYNGILADKEYWKNIKENNVVLEKKDKVQAK